MDIHDATLAVGFSGGKSRPGRVRHGREQEKVARVEEVGDPRSIAQSLTINKRQRGRRVAGGTWVDSDLSTCNVGVGTSYDRHSGHPMSAVKDGGLETPFLWDWVARVT